MYCRTIYKQIIIFRLYFIQKYLNKSEKDFNNSQGRYQIQFLQYLIKITFYNILDYLKMKHQVRILKKQFDEKRDILVDHLQQKISTLQIQRQLLRKKEQLNRIKSQQKVKNKIDPIQLKNNIQENRQKLSQLQILYKRKKELEQLGIKVNKPQDIKNFELNKQYVFANKQEIKRKNKVIKEEMQKAKDIILRDKISKKQMKKCEEIKYKELIKTNKGIEEETKFEFILGKPKLKKVEEEYLLKTVFQVLQNQKQLVSKIELKYYLTYNPDFCNRFSIGKRDIIHDLGVYQTKVQGKFNYHEFYEFVKTLQITFKSMNPTKKFANNNNNNNIKNKIDNKKIQEKPKNPPNENNKNDKKQQLFKKYLEFLFQKIDKKKEKIILRSIYSEALKKQYTTNPTFKDLPKDYINEFTNCVQKTEKQQQDYYKRLSKQYVTLDQIFREFQWFYTHYNLNLKLQPQKIVNNLIKPSPLNKVENLSNITQLTQSKVSQQQQYQASQISSQPQLKQQPKQQQVDPQFYQQKIQQIKIKPNQLKQFDRYYNLLAKDNESQIKQNEYYCDVSQDIVKLEKYIKFMENKNNKQ